MRVGELVSLKPEDIYMSTMQVYISKGKNHRDRWTILSERALDLLKEYWCYSIHGSVNDDPVRLLFCGDLTILL